MLEDRSSGVCGQSSQGSAPGETPDQLRRAIITWVEETYDHRRRQRVLGKLIPAEIEAIIGCDTLAIAALSHKPAINQSLGRPVIPDGAGACELEEWLGERDAVDDVDPDVRHQPFALVAEAREALGAEDEGDAR